MTLFAGLPKQHTHTHKKNKLSETQKMIRQSVQYANRTASYVHNYEAEKKTEKFETLGFAERSNDLGLFCG